MTSLRQAFEKKGFKPPESMVREEREDEARVYLAQEAKNLAAGKRDRQRKDLLLELSTISSVQKFRVIGKKLLLIDPQMIVDVVNIAHNRGIHEKRKEGGSALIAQLLQVRSELKRNGLTEQEMANIVSRTVSKH